MPEEIKETSVDNDVEIKKEEPVKERKKPGPKPKSQKVEEPSEPIQPEVIEVTRVTEEVSEPKIESSNQSIESDTVEDISVETAQPLVEDKVIEAEQIPDITENVDDTANVIKTTIGQVRIYAGPTTCATYTLYSGKLISLSKCNEFDEVNAPVPGKGIVHGYVDSRLIKQELR